MNLVGSGGCNKTRTHVLHTLELGLARVPQPRRTLPAEVCDFVCSFCGGFGLEVIPSGRCLVNLIVVLLLLSLPPSAHDRAIENVFQRVPCRDLKSTIS